MKILIVYEEIPETTKLYVEEVTPVEWKWMQKCAGEYINTTTLKGAALMACDKLSEWLVGKTPVSTDVPVRGEGFDYVLVTGFIL